MLPIPGIAGYQPKTTAVVAAGVRGPGLSARQRPDPLLASHSYVR
jgi:hypothetical protein